MTETYLVGGAVRDHLLNRPVKDRDWVVVGSTAEKMIQQGYQQVGADFPVFLHPDTREEYALARTERKTKAGYHGFVVDASASVTLEQDLARRDLTINAIAQAEDGTLIDPLNGLDDLRKKRLRHASPAFSEDPVRILRVARFAARFAHLGFQVAEDTMALMIDMVDSGEVDALVPERVFAELRSALTEPDPQCFIQVLRQCGALARILPEVDALYGVPQTEKYHPEVDTGIHLELCLKQAALLETNDLIRFCVLCHDLGKALTPAKTLPSHHGHELAGVKPTKALCERLKVPSNWKQLALLVTEFHTHTHRVRELKASTLMKLFKRLDITRKPERANYLSIVGTIDARGRLGHEEARYPQAEFLQNAAEAYLAINVQSIVAGCEEPSQIRAAIDGARLEALRQFKRAQQ
ncbi:MAG: multifunctional CCA addition/repair protein [Gammaproteobacteria bacterium]|nr:multifunctional CCA addition/repair protein [Gammaproteobacteria bacterium]